MLRSDKPFHFLLQLAPILSTVLLGGLVACSTPTHLPVTPSDSDEALRELVLTATTLTVNKLTESEVVIRFDPPNGLSITNLRFRLDTGTWYYVADPSQGWHLKSDRLSLGDHTVEMRAVANGKRPLFGTMYLKVVEEGAQETSWGKDGTTSNVRLVI